MDLSVNPIAQSPASMRQSQTCCSGSMQQLATRRKFHFSSLTLFILILNYWNTPEKRAMIEVTVTKKPDHVNLHTLSLWCSQEETQNCKH